MALTQEQKNTILYISQDPNNTLKDFIKRPLYLTSFKNEFFQDGTGLIDKTLSQYLITNDIKFLEIYAYIVNHSTLTIFDNKGNKPSAFSSLHTLKDSVTDFSEKIFTILEKTDIKNIAYESFLLEKNILELYNNGLKDKALLSIHKYFPLLSAYRELLTSVVKNDDIDFLNEFVNNELSQDFFTVIDFHKDFNNKSPYKNIYYYALENSSQKIATFLIDKFPELSSNEKNRLLSGSKKFVPTLEMIHKIPSLLNKTISTMSDKVLSQNFNYMTTSAEKILTSLLNTQYSDFLETSIINLLNSNIEKYEKINLFKSIFESSISYDRKFFILSCGLDEQINEKYSTLAVFNSFIFSVQKNPLITQNLFDQFINEFKLRDLISEDQVFNSQYFNNMEYFKLINNSYLFSKINPLNFLESYLKTVNKSNDFNDDKDYIWYKISKLNFQTLSSNDNSFNSLHLMLVNNFDRYVNFFEKDKINYLLSKNFKITSYNKNIHSKDFYEVVDKLIDTGFNFNEDSNKLLKLMSFNPPESLLNKIIEKNNISIEYLSKEKTFWKYINTQQMFDYCLKNKAILSNSEHLISLVYSNESLALELYLNNSGNMNYLNEQGNILHNLCQDSGILKAEEILTLLDYYPNLAIYTNKQNKFPVSYLITDFNKLCKNHIETPFNNTNRKNLEIYYKVIKTMFQCGLHSDNKKAFNILESQLLKYTNITDTFNDLIPTLRAEKLAKKLEVKGITVKKLKI